MIIVKIRIVTVIKIKIITVTEVRIMIFQIKTVTTKVIMMIIKMKKHAKGSGPPTVRPRKAS